MNVKMLVKLLNLSTSSNEHEALRAIQKANEIVKKDNLTWDKIFDGAIPTETPKHHQPQKKPGRAKKEQPESVVDIGKGLFKKKVHDKIFYYGQYVAWLLKELSELTIPSSEKLIAERLDDKYKEYGCLSVSDYTDLINLYKINISRF